MHDDEDDNDEDDDDEDDGWTSLSKRSNGDILDWLFG